MTKPNMGIVITNFPTDKDKAFRQLSRLVKRCAALQEELNDLRADQPAGWMSHYQQVLVELIETKRLLADQVLSMAHWLPLPEGVEE